MIVTQGKKPDIMESQNTSESTPKKRKLPAGMKPWQPGQSGNPGGRPAMPADVREALEAGSGKAARRLAELVDSPDERVALLASQALLDRLYGKPAQAVDKTVTVTSVQQQHLSILMELQAKRDQAMKAIEGHTDKVVEYDPPKRNE